MENLKIVLFGLGNVGQGITQELLKKKGIEIVGAIGRTSNIGKDLGEVLGIGKKMGVNITNDADALLKNTYADIAIHSTSSRTLKEIYPEIIKPIQNGMNVITACTEASDPYLYNPEIAGRIERLARASQVTFLGTGSTQLATRVVLTLAEACTEINTVKFTAHADVSEFSEKSNREEFGIGTTVDIFNNEINSGQGRMHEGLKKEAAVIAEKLGWHLDDIQQIVEPDIEAGYVTGITVRFKGIKNGVIKVEYNYQFVLDPNHVYSHEIIIDGKPKISTVVYYSPDRGLTGTIAPMINAIPKVIRAKPGILKMADLEICPTWDDVRTDLG